MPNHSIYLWDRECQNSLTRSRARREDRRDTWRLRLIYTVAWSLVIGFGVFVFLLSR